MFKKPVKSDIILRNIVYFCIILPTTTMKSQNQLLFNALVLLSFLMFTSYASSTDLNETLSASIHPDSGIKNDSYVPFTGSSSDGQDLMYNNQPTQSTIDETGTLVPHCSDISTSLSLNKVQVRIYKNNTLVDSFYTGMNGKCEVARLHPGDYNIVFTTNNYSPYSTMHVGISAGGYTYIEVPMTKDGYEANFFNNQILFLLTVGISFLLILGLILSLSKLYKQPMESL